MKAFRHYPVISILIFIGLYLFSVSLYPGGSQANANSAGFDWLNNYWCNLLNERAMNGEINPARPYAIGAMGILCSGLAAFFYQFPRYFPLDGLWSLAVPIAGIGSMLCALLIFTKFHDLMTSLSSLFGLVALCGVFLGLKAAQSTLLLGAGVFCVVLMGINNYIYYLGDYLAALPLIQKITFACVLSWVIGIDLSFGKQSTL